jgi:hypothetical protein
MKLWPWGSPPSAVSDARAAAQLPESPNKRPVENKLRALRDSARLVTHVWEETDPYKFPEEPHSWLTELKAEDVLPRVEDHNIPLVSTTLIPSLSNSSIHPFGVQSDYPVKGMYLINMQQDVPHPPIVFKAHSYSLCSGSNVRKKKFHDKDCWPQKLFDLYKPVPDEGAWRHALAENPRELSNRQLDYLDEYYVQKELSADQKNIMQLNEVIVEAAKEHIAAIAIPYHSFTGRASVYPPEKNWYPAVHKLTAALAGMQHLNKGMQVPVVTYQVSPPQEGMSVQQGDFVYLGQSKQEFAALALNALEELKAQDDKKLWEFVRTSQNNATNMSFEFGHAKDLKNAVQESFGIDITKPLRKQKPAVDALKAAAENAEGMVL